MGNETPRHEENMQNAQVTMLPRSQSAEIELIPLVSSGELRENLKRASSLSMSLLSKSARRLTELVELSPSAREAIDASNALAGTIQVQTNLIKMATELLKTIKLKD